MKKLYILFTLLLCLTLNVQAADKKPRKESRQELRMKINRTYEILAMDKSVLTTNERQALRDEVRSMRNDERNPWDARVGDVLLYALFLGLVLLAIIFLADVLN